MIYLGADHAGFKLKEKIKKYFDKKGIEFEDLGNYKLQKEDDYPDFGDKVAKAVAKNSEATGILICGSSFGVCMVANKTKGIRAASIKTTKDAKLARNDDHANVMCLSGWSLKFMVAKRLIKSWMNTPYSTEKRHVRRVGKITKIENKVI